MSSDSSTFSGKLRTRICGLLVEDEAVLLTQIHSPVTQSLIWIPPGGGLQYGETMRACLQRELLEETNLRVSVKNLVHINELIDLPYHALEYYYEVERVSGEPKLGSDPELHKGRQVLQDLQWIALEELSTIKFAPPGLLKKLQDWDNRFSYSVF
ncbi:MAG TPA: NUDIX hydrolase [Balneolaceae bacterium]|nr:NUDIX hydrolase [Balneolaceae bacterium]